MNTSLCVFADFEQAPLGGPSWLNSELAGAPVLLHMLRRAARIEHVGARLLVVQPRDREQAQAVLARHQLERTFEVCPLGSDFQMHQRLMRAGRRWNPWAWRGSPIGATSFDEFVDVPALARIMNQTACEAVLCVESHMAALDVSLSSEMVQSVRQNPSEFLLTFTQAPPGIVGILLQRCVVRELMEHNLPLGMLLSYRPELPRLDPITRPGCVRIDRTSAAIQARLSADTIRGRELLEAAFQANGTDVSAIQLCDWLTARQSADPAFLAGELPREIELEITTEYPFPDTKLRPRRELPGRRIENLAAIERLSSELAHYDDRLVILGGHGDPLLHPQLHEICGLFRRAGIGALGIATPLTELPDRTLELLLSTPVDLVQVTIDAHSAATYTQSHGRDHFQQVLANIERLRQGRQARKSPEPLIVPSITRCCPTLPEIEAFFDEWMKKTDWALIEGFNDYCGALPRDSLLTAEPLVRGACRRLWARLFLAADGNVPQCSQDFAGTTSIGNWHTQPLHEIWRGPKLSLLRDAHSAGRWRSLPLCGKCSQWMRP